VSILRVHLIVPEGAILRQLPSRLVKSGVVAVRVVTSCMPISSRACSHFSTSAAMPILMVEKPDWLGREVTSDSRYSNANLAKVPFRRWPAPSQVPIPGLGSEYANHNPDLKARSTALSRS